jgi:hypothetical protein
MPVQRHGAGDALLPIVGFGRDRYVTSVTMA